MIKNVMIAILIVVVLISGCVSTQPLIDGTQQTPAQITPALSVYGELLDYIQNNLTTLKIHSEIVNYELNNTKLEVVADTSNTPNLTRTFVIDKLEDLEIGKYYEIDEVFRGVYNGTFIDSMGEEYIWLISDKRGFSIPLEDFKNATYEVHTPVSELSKGENYVFYFYKMHGDDLWTLSRVSENLTKYKEEASLYHKNDLTRDQRIDIEESEGELEPGEMRTGRVFPTFIMPGGETELKIDLINRQDNDITYVIKDAKIVDEKILQPWKSHWEEPPYEERLENSIVDECEVEFDSQESTIPANSTKELKFEVTCEDTIECRVWHVSDLYGNVTTDCELVLWGQIEFVDEFGNKHVIPEKGLLKQMLTTGQRTNIIVEHSEEIYSKEEFFIYADYEDTEGNDIVGAQMELEFSDVWGIFSMRYDDSLGKYKFLWSTFYEHAPPFEGIYEFTVTARKTGYEIQRKGPYTISIL